MTLWWISGAGHVMRRAWNSRGISGSAIPAGAGRLEEFATVKHPRLLWLRRGTRSSH